MDEAFVSRALENLLKSQKWGPPLRALFIWYAEAAGQEDASEIEVELAAKALPEATEHLRQKSTNWLGCFRKLQDVSVGRVVLGRRQRQTRFVWHDPPVPLAREALRIAQGDEAYRGAALSESNAGAASETSHPFPLRHGRTVFVKVPEDITREELDRLADFTRLLPIKSL